MNFRVCSASGKMWTGLHVNLCWAYAEQISSHTEHTQNEFHRWLSIRGTDFIACWTCAEMFKSRISQPNLIQFWKISCYRHLGPYGFGFCKKSRKKISCLCTFKEDKRIWRMRQDYFAVYGEHANWHKIKLISANFRPKLNKNLIQNLLTEHDRMGKKPSHATVPFKGAQAWDIRLQGFYTNQPCTGWWARN